MAKPLLPNENDRAFRYYCNANISIKIPWNELTAKEKRRFYFLSKIFFWRVPKR